MPKIPDYSPRTSLVPDAAPGAEINPGLSGASADALGDFGAGAANIGHDLLQKRKQAEDRDFAFQKTMEDSRELEKHALELQMKMPRDYKGYSDALQTWINDRFEGNQKAAPSNTAKQLYQQASGETFNRAIIRARATEHVERAKAYVFNIEDQVQKTGNAFVLTPNEEWAVNEMLMVRSKIRGDIGTTITAEQAAELEKRELNKLSKSLLQGLYNKEDYAKGLKILARDPGVYEKLVVYEHETRMGSIDDAVEAGAMTPEEAEKLKKKNPNTRVAIPTNPKVKGEGMGIQEDLLTGALTPEERFQWMEKFKDAKKTKKKVDRTMFYAHYSDHKSALRNGEAEMSPTIVPTLKEMEASGERPPGYAQRRIDELNTDYTVGQVIKRSKTAPASEFKQLAEGYESQRKALIKSWVERNPEDAYLGRDDFNHAYRADAKEDVLRLQEQILRERYEDPVAYIQKNFPNYRSMWAATGNGNDQNLPATVDTAVKKYRALQETLEIPPHLRRIQSKEESAAIARLLNGADSKSAAELISGLQYKYGEHYHDVMAEMVKDKHLDAKYLDVAQATHPLDRMEVVATIKNGKEVSEYFASRPREEVSELEEAVKSHISDYEMAELRASDVGGTAAQVNRTREVVMQQAKRIMMQGETDVKKAAAQAAAIIHRNRKVSKSARSWNEVPTTIHGKTMDLSLIDAYKVAYLKPEGLDELKVAMPVGNEGFSHLPKEEQRKAFYAHVQETGYWADNGARTGMYLMYRDPKTGRPKHVRNERNERVEAKHFYISTQPTKRTTEEAKGGWGILRSIF